MIYLISIFYFIFIIWESFSSHRKSISALNLNFSLEWLQNLPPTDHCYNELPAVSKT